MNNNNNNNNAEANQPQKKEAQKKDAPEKPAPNAVARDNGRDKVLADRAERRKARRELKKKQAVEKQKRIELYRPFLARAPLKPPAPVPGHPRITEHILAFPKGAEDFHGLVMNKAHLNDRIVEVYEQPDVDLSDVREEEMLELVANPEVDWTEALHMGVDYYGNQNYKQPKAMESNLKALINYCKSPKAAPDIKPKLLFVLKELRTNRDALGAVVMMAAHSGVCNVQKEIGVRLAYGAIAETQKSDCDVNDPRNGVLRLLYECREMCVESLYCAQALNGHKSLNSHPLMGYRNAIHQWIGLNVVPDPDTSNNQTAHHYVDTFFERFYTIETMLQCILKALNDEPRKLHYNSVISFLKYNRPDKFASDPEEFLFHCFDENGKFTIGGVAWMLYRMKILNQKKDGEVDVDALFPELDDEVLDEIRKSVSGVVDNTPLKRSGEELKNEIVHSIELAQSCEHLNRSK